MEKNPKMNDDPCLGERVRGPDDELCSLDLMWAQVSKFDSHTRIRMFEWLMAKHKELIHHEYDIKMNAIKGEKIKNGGR